MNVDIGRTRLLILPEIQEAWLLKAQGEAILNPVLTAFILLKKKSKITQDTHAKVNLK